MECRICLEEYSADVNLQRRPKLLPCGHEVCESCLRKLYASNNNVVKCPQCQTKHRVEDLSSLPVVFALIQDSPTRTHRRCSEELKKCNKSVRRKCQHCEKWFCGDHFKIHKGVVIAECSEFVMQAQMKLEEREENISSFIEASKSTEQINERIKKLIRDLQSLSRDCQKTEDEQHRLLQSLLEDHSDTKLFVDEFKLAFDSGKNFDKIWKMATDWENLSKMLIDFEVPEENVKVFQDRLSNILFSAFESTSMAVDFVATADAESEQLSLTAQLQQDKTLLDEKFILLKKKPSLIMNLSKNPWDLAVVRSTKGFSLQSGIVVKGNSGFPLPSPALLVNLCDVNDFLTICDETGDVKGKIKLNYCNPEIERLAVLGDEKDILITDKNNKCVKKLSLSGDVIMTSEDGVFCQPCGLCFLPDGKLAVCDMEKKTVCILSLSDLTLLTTVNHPHITQPYAVTATSSHLVVTNWNQNARLIFFSLSDFSFVKHGIEVLNLPTILLHYKENIFTSTSNNKVIQMSETGTRISTVGSGRNGNLHFYGPTGLAIITSSKDDEDEETLVVADSGNSRLKLYTL